MKTKGTAKLLRKARALSSLLLVLAMIVSLPGVVSPSVAQAASQPLENSVLKVVLDDSDLKVSEFYYPLDVATNHMSVAEMGIKYDGAGFMWFRDLTKNADGSLQTSDNKLRLVLGATLEGNNPYFTTSVTVTNLTQVPVANLTLFQGSDEDIQGPAANDIALYIPEVDAVVAYDSDKLNLYLGFAGSLHSAAHDVGGAGDMWANVEADTLNNANSSWAIDIGIAQKWVLGNIVGGGTASLKVTWAVGTNPDQFKHNIIAADTTAPTMQPSTLTSPNGGQSWAGGSTQTITWNPADISDPTLKANPITLYYLDSGSAPVQIATDEANDGSYTWTVPSLNISTARVRITATDLATHTASDESNAVFAIDSTAPTVALTYAPNRAVRDAEPLVITATFSEAMTASPTIAVDTTGTDLGATNMTATANAAIWTYSYDVPAGSDGLATVTISGSDLAGHPNQAATNNTFTIDNIAPTLSIGGPSASLTTSGPVTYTVTYAGADSVTLANANIALNSTGTANGTVSVTGSGTASRTVTISNITGDGTLGITIAAGTASDAAGNSAPGAGPSATFATDNTAPTLPRDNIVGTTVDGFGDTITLTFSESVTAAGGWLAAFTSIQSPPDGASLTIAHATFFPSAADTPTATLTITLDGNTDQAYLVNGKTIAVTPKAGAIVDAAGNPLASAKVVGTALNSSDDRPPRVELTYKVNQVARNVARDADILVITATFSEAMVWNSPAIAIDTTFIDLPATPMTMVGGDKKVWSFSYDVPPASDGTAAVTISGTDLAGNLNLPATNNTFTIDNTAPTLPAANIVGATVQGQGDTIVLTFSEPLTAPDGWASAFSSIKSPPAGNALDLTHAGFLYSGNTLTITLDEALDSAYLVNGRTIAVTPAAGKITDAAGNPVANTEVVGTTANSGDSAAPTVGLTYSPNRPVKDTENLTITAAFGEAMTASPTITIDAPGDQGNVTNAAMAGGPTIWTYSYDVPGGTDGTATVTISGTDLAGNANEAATNSTFTIDNGPPPRLPADNIVGATVQRGGDTIVLTFSEPVAAADNDWRAAFTSIKSPPAGNALSMTSARFEYSGNTLTITLDEASDGVYLVNGNAIAVTPATGKITDVAGNPLADTSVEGTTAVSGDTVAPTVSLAYTPNHAVKGGDPLVITATFSEDVVWTTAPTIAIATQGNGDLDAVAMAMVGTDRAKWYYSWTVASGTDEDGTAIVTISGKDLAGNDSQPATNSTFTIDNTAPSLPEANIVGTTRQGQGLGDTIAITFSEPVVAADGTWSANEVASLQSPGGAALTFANAGFVYSEDTNTLTITLSEAADNSYRAYLVNGNKIAVTPAQGQITDVAGNPLANTTVVGTAVVTGDAVRPTATLAYSPDRTVRDDDTLVITAAFSEAMATEPTIFIDTQGIDLAAAMVMGANNTIWSYTYDVPPGSDGVAMVIISGADLAGNSVEVTFNNTFRINNTSPTLSVANIVGTTVQDGRDTIVLTFSEPVAAANNDWRAAFTALARSDGTPLALDHATLTYSAAANTLTITLDEATDGAYLVNGNLIAVTPAPGKITDIAGNALASDQVVSAAAVSGDNTRPTVSLAYDPGRPVRNGDNLAITATFSEAMAASPTIAIDTPGSDLSDTRLTVVAETGNKVWTYSYAVPSGSNGAAFVTISGTDLAGNPESRLVGTTNSLFTIDNTPPAVSLSSTATEPTSVVPIPVTVTFSEAVVGFGLGDVTVGNGVAGNLTGMNNTVFTFTVAPASQGTVTVNIAAGVAQDAAGNSNNAATQLSRTYQFGPTLVLTSPNGGEDWPIGSTQAITWSSYGLRGLVRIELSRDGGATWRTIVSRTRDDGAHTLTVPGPDTTQARVRVSSISARGVSVTSGANFTISVPELTVTSPGINTVWDIGDRVTITWTTTVFSGLVRIELSRDGGQTWTGIVSRTRNDGSHTWKVRGPATTTAMVRVTSLSTGGSDTNDISFRIEE